MRTHPRCWLYRPLGRISLQKAPRVDDPSKKHTTEHAHCAVRQSNTRDGWCTFNMLKQLFDSRCREQSPY